MLNVFLIVFAYLLGSLSTAVIACRLLGLADPRLVGSGNPGATNVLRTGGRQAAVITLAGDVLKSLLPVALARSFGLEHAAIGAVALAAFCGHLYPAFYWFKGGKGVATALGALLGMHPLVGLLALVTWLIVAFLFRFASLASLATSLAAPVFTLWITDSTKLVIATIVMSALIFYRHRDNIRHLLAGSEHTIGNKA